MTKEQALEDFFSGLKVAFNISALYKKEHPSFLKAAKEFQNKVDATFIFLNPIRIGVSPDSLIIDGNVFAGQLRYEDLAKMFHQRRIKNIEIKRGITLDELVIFLSKFSAPQREIFKEGGVVNILGRENVKYISVVELDYSQLLESDGEGCEDVWAYLLKDAVANDDGRKINELADNFDNVAKHLKAEELVKDKEFRANIDKFLSYLKTNNNSKFSKCLAGMAKSIINDKSLIFGDTIDKLKTFFDNLSEKDISSLLSEEIFENENFDSLSFNLLCRLVENRDHEKIAVLTEKSLKSKTIKDNAKIKKKIEGLFSLPDNPVISEVYRSTLNIFLKELTFEKNLVLDRDLMKTDYRFVLLNLLNIEEDKGQITLILERLSRVWEEIIHDSDLGYLKLFLEILSKKRGGDNSFNTIFAGVDKLISNFVENIMWDDHAPLEIEYFIDNLQLSSEGVDFYINKIFNENKLNYNILKFFLKFFPDSLFVFCSHLEKKHSDMDFIKNIIDNVSKIDSYFSIEILKCVYHFPNSLIKIEVLKVMGTLSLQDNTFLFPILRRGDLFSRREAFSLLIRDVTIKQRVLEEFLLMASPWGAKNNILLENIMIVEEMSLIEAKDYLERLTKRRFFWNRNVRKKAKAVLRKWHDRKN